MENIDWSQAPEGATHYADSSGFFYKVYHDTLMYCDGRWNTSLYKDIAQLEKYHSVIEQPKHKENAMKEFKVGDKVYCPSLTTEILVLNHNLSGRGNYVLTLSFACRVMRFTVSGKDRTENINNSIFHATSENHKLLEQIYQCTFETPALTSSMQIIKLLNENTTGKPILCVSKKDPTVILQIISYNYSLGFFVDINKNFHGGSLELFTNFTPHQLD
jgi:hypothetical protein